MKVGLSFFQEAAQGRAAGPWAVPTPRDTPGSLGCTLARLHGHQGGQLGHSPLSLGEGNTPKAQKLRLTSPILSPPIPELSLLHQAGEGKRWEGPSLPWQSQGCLSFSLTNQGQGLPPSKYHSLTFTRI